MLHFANVRLYHIWLCLHALSQGLGSGVQNGSHIVFAGPADQPRVRIGSGARGKAPTQNHQNGLRQPLSDLRLGSVETSGTDARPLVIQVGLDACRFIEHTDVDSGISVYVHQVHVNAFAFEPISDESARISSEEHYGDGRPAETLYHPGNVQTLASGVYVCLFDLVRLTESKLIDCKSLIHRRIKRHGYYHVRVPQDDPMGLMSAPYARLGSSASS